MRRAAAPQNAPIVSIGLAEPNAADDLVPVALPHDHPAWQRDVVSVSARTRALLAALQPVVVRVRTFWDHAVRAVTVGARGVEVDASGSYRVTGMFR